jgi:hypothetical protein
MPRDPTFSGSPGDVNLYLNRCPVQWMGKTLSEEGTLPLPQLLWQDCRMQPIVSLRCCQNNNNNNNNSSRDGAVTLHAKPWEKFQERDARNGT